MKKKPRSLIRKFVLYLFAALFFITTIIFLVFGVKGYFMYREAVKAYPISQMVSSIQNRENFVEYDELPTIYIDAVISAEDKRFESHCGVDLIAISRAVVNDIKAMSFVKAEVQSLSKLLKINTIHKKKSSKENLQKYLRLLS